MIIGGWNVLKELKVFIKELLKQHKNFALSWPTKTYRITKIKNKEKPDGCRI